MTARSDQVRVLIEAAAGVALEVSVEAYRKPHAYQHNVPRTRLSELLDALVPFVGGHSLDGVQRRREAIVRGDTTRQCEACGQIRHLTDGLCNRCRAEVRP